MLDGYSQREPERFEHLGEQVLYLLHSLRSYRCSDLIVLWARWNVRYSDPLRKTFCRLHDGIMVLRVDQRLRVSGELQALGRQLLHRTGRDALDELLREGVVHHCSDDGNAFREQEGPKEQDSSNQDAGDLRRTPIVGRAAAPGQSQQQADGGGGGKSRAKSNRRRSNLWTICQYRELAGRVYRSGRNTMRQLNFRGLIARFTQSHKGTRSNSSVVICCLVLFIIVLSACGSTVTGQTSTVTPAPTLTPSPTASPTHVPTPTPTPTPTEALQPTQPSSTPAPAILDLQPLSMSIVGHLDCQKNGKFVCFARVLSRSSNQSDLHWTAFTNVPGNIGFSPVSGVLAAGQSVLVTITVPFNACTPGLFFFRGPVNTHTITWAC